MAHHGCSTWFVGDLQDPWVVSIADALPAAAERVDCAGNLPESLASLVAGATVLVLHRATLTGHDADWLERLRATTTPPRVVLCHGPHVRHADLERWATLFDAAVPEATARDTIARRLPSGGETSGDGPLHRIAAATRPRVAIVSGNVALRQTLADACEAAGYSVLAVRDWTEVPALGLAVWDVPVLDPDWPHALPSQRRAAPWIALIGFADRPLVNAARSQGAAVCLELPLDLADLVAALDRLTAPRCEPPHSLPPTPAGRRRAGQASKVAEGGREG